MPSVTQLSRITMMLILSNHVATDLGQGASRLRRNARPCTHCRHFKLGWTNGWMEGWMNGGMDEWMDGGLKSEVFPFKV